MMDICFFNGSGEAVAHRKGCPPFLGSRVWIDSIPWIIDSVDYSLSYNQYRAEVYLSKEDKQN